MFYLCYSGSCRSEWMTRDVLLQTLNLSPIQSPEVTISIKGFHSVHLDLGQNTFKISTENLKKNAKISALESGSFFTLYGRDQDGTAK